MYIIILHLSLTPLMKTRIPDYSPLLIAALVFSLTSAALSSTSPALFVPMRCPRRKVSVGAVLSPLDQGKLDFVGSLENAYDPNHENPVSTSFLRHLVDQSSPEIVTRDMVESFGQLGTGKWRIVYAEECSTSFGFGSLFGGASTIELELENDSKVTCHVHCNEPLPFQLSIEGSYGTARHNMIIKVNNVQAKQAHIEGNSGLNEPFSPLKGGMLSMTHAFLERTWRTIFAGVVVIDIAFIDKNLAIFDLNFLARMRGTRICARKEPDFF